jgi:uncharacterized protein YbaP (TraB family)
MRHRILSLLLFLGSLSCQPRPVPVPLPSGSKLFSWKVSSPTSEACLLGTVLLGRRETLPLAREIEDAFERSRILMVPYDEAKTDLSRMRRFVAERGMYPEDDGLSQRLRPETLRILFEKVEEQGLSVGTVERMRPWLLSVNLKVQVIKDLDYIPRRSISRHFQEAAREKKKEIVELEGAEHQNTILADLPAEMQEQLLLATLQDLKEMKESLAVSAECWLKGDAEGMERERIRTPLEKHPERRALQERILDARSVRMAEKIADALKDKGPLFVLLPVDHLLGDAGVLNLLRKRGYSVEQMEIP